MVKAVINGILLLLLSAAVHAQSGVNLRSPLHIPAESMRLDSLLNLVTRQTGARFSLNTRKIQPGKDIRLKKGATTIGALLANMQQSTGVHYILRGSHVIFLDNPPKPVLKKAVARSVTHQQKVKAPAPVIHQQQNKDTIALRPVSVPQPVLLSSVNTVAPSSISVRRHIPPKVFAVYPIAEKKERPARQRREGLPLFEARAALNGDETFYLSPTAEIGLPYLFGSVSWNTNFDISGIRYGAGAAFRVFREWRLAVIATAGTAASLTYDSVIIKWSSKQRLYRGALLARKQLGGNWNVQFGPVFNMLRTSYYRDDEPATPLVPTELADIRFHAIKPRYTISDSYSPDAPTSTKLWIGFQLGVYYNIPLLRRR